MIEWLCLQLRRCRALTEAEFTRAKAICPLNDKLRLLYRGVARDFVLARMTLGSLLAFLNLSKAALLLRLVMSVSGRSARAESAMALALLGPVWNTCQSVSKCFLEVANHPVTAPVVGLECYVRQARWILRCGAYRCSL